MGFVRKTPTGNFRACWRDPAGYQRSKSFATKREAGVFLAQVESAKAKGSYVAPAAGKGLFGDHAELWLSLRATEKTTAARDKSVMRNHVIAKWGTWPLAKIEHMDVQEWVVELAMHHSRWLLTKCLQLTSNVMRSAVRNRLIDSNPCEDFAMPALRRRDTDERIITRSDLRELAGAPVWRPAAAAGLPAATFCTTAPSASSA